MKSFLILFFVFLFSIQVSAADSKNHDQARTAVHLLSYIAQDYPGAVENGVVKDQGEYTEQLEFVGIIIKNLADLKNESPEWELLGAEGKKLLSLCRQKKSAKEVAAFALELRNKIITLGKVASAPLHLPDLKTGKQLFAQNCVSCHGSEGFGDGPMGEGLEPAPTNFHDQERLSQISPFGAFNTIKLGVSGTAMQGFGDTFSDNDIWSLSYYVTHLRYSDKQYLLKNEDKDKIQGIYLLLEEASTSSDLDLSKKYFKSDDQENLNLVASLRVDFVNGQNGPNDPGAPPQAAFINKANFLLKAAKEAFLANDQESARAFALNAYLEGVEPIEPQLKSLNPSFVSQIELQMSKLRQAINNKNQSTFDQSFNQLNSDLKLAKEMFKESGTSDMGQFLMALGIVLREGLEAVLIVATILTVINAFQIPGLALWVHIGWISALFLGVLSWFFSGMIMGGLQRELLEGLASYFAVLVLLSMGLWLHSKSEVGKWKDFIKGKTQHYISNGKMLGIASLSFVATFREVFETVVFLRALSLEDGKVSGVPVLLGFLTALMLVIVFAILFIKLGQRLPLSKIFSVSSGMMLVLAIILAGKGTHALQEAGIVSLAPISFPFIEILGIYPSLWTVFAQVFIALIALGIWIISNRPIKRATV